VVTVVALLKLPPVVCGEQSHMMLWGQKRQEGNGTVYHRRLYDTNGLGVQMWHQQGCSLGYAYR
jgi:hypothetical protein